MTIFLTILGIINFLGLVAEYITRTKSMNKEAESMTGLLKDYNTALDSFDTRLKKMEINFKQFFQE